MSADRQPITAPDAPAAVGPYSHAVRSGGFLFLSGQTPLDPATGKLVDGDDRRADAPVPAQPRGGLRGRGRVAAQRGPLRRSS